jgi:hypothetical protein
VVAGRKGSSKNKGIPDGMIQLRISQFMNKFEPAATLNFNGENLHALMTQEAPAGDHGILGKLALLTPGGVVGQHKRKYDCLNQGHCKKGKVGRAMEDGGGLSQVRE